MHASRCRVALAGLAAASVCVALGGCARSGSGRLADLVGSEWVVEDIDGRGVIDNARVSLAFDDDGGVSGFGSCNTYGASYALKGGRLAIGQAAATLRACAPALMNQEQKFFDTLAKVSGYSIDETGALILTGPAGRRILARR